MTYLEAAREFYAEAARTPQPGLCCTTSPSWTLPDLELPQRMLEMNYGCGTTVHARDLAGKPTVAYVGVGGGLELLQFAYFSRRPGAIIGIDPVEDMLDRCAENLQAAGKLNPWFDPAFVLLRQGDALEIPLAQETVDVFAQNCLFNIFEPADLCLALAEAHRVLRPSGRLLLSDPVTPIELPETLRRDERLRAMCLGGAQTLDRYCELLVGAGFGMLEIRARRPYRVLDPGTYAVEEPILLESVEIAAVREPAEADGPCIFTGRTAFYVGPDAEFDDGRGHHLVRGIPSSVCDKTAENLQRLGRRDLIVTDSTFFYEGGGCC